ncbi:uncharacterized protein L201_006515 [Kwoniella dendrophila CBS 6074]|uniref:BZIP domain-containing protein n=1 Tax=Kwoniella dendrophila CBS 6074 TaxID=1295534 RepID=A0AAX4K383_9TREE
MTALPPAPSPAPVPLPKSRNAPNAPNAPPGGKKYSEGSMYEDLSPEDVEAWHRRYAEFKKWRQEIPSRHQDGHLGIGTGSTPSLGVGSADWNWVEPSECGTIPTTIIERAWETARSRTNNLAQDQGQGHLGPQAEPPAPNPPKSHSVQNNNQSTKSKSNLNIKARVETLSGSETPPSQPASRPNTIRPPLSQRTVIPQNTLNTHHRPTIPLKTPTIEIQPPSSKTPTQVQQPPQNLRRASNPAKSRDVPSKAPNAPVKATSSPKPNRPSPTPLLAYPPSHTKQLSEQKIPSHSSSVTRSGEPGKQLIPSPTSSTQYAEREAYIASALSLPLEMLTETEGPLPPVVPSSSQLTTGRLDSLLGRNHNDSRTKGSQRSAGSGTTLPSVKSDKATQRTPGYQDTGANQLARSKTTSAIPTKSEISGKGPVNHTGHRYEDSIYLSVPGVLNARSRTPSDATIDQAVNRPLPHSTHNLSRASTVSPIKSNGNVTQVPSQKSQRSAHSATSKTTVILAVRKPLPSSKATTASDANPSKHAANIKNIPEVSKPAARLVPSNATIIQARQIPLPATTGRTTTMRSSNSVNDRAQIPQDQPLSPIALLADSMITMKKGSAPTHRQQMPLPRPALTPQASCDGLTQATSLGRKHRDPSVGDLTAHFEPTMYPLPPSGATFFSSPENIGNLPPRPADGHEVAFTTVEYIPPESLHSTNATSISVAQPPAKLRSTKSTIPPTPAVRAAAIPLPASTVVILENSTSRTTPSAPPSSSASPPAPPSPPVTSTSQPVQAISAARHSRYPSQSRAVPPALIREPKATSQSRIAPVEVMQDVHHDQDHPHIHISPAQVSPSLASDDDHISFEVPSGSRGRLRVSLKWLKDGARTSRMSSHGGRLSIVEEEVPPPLPPKTSSLISRVISKATQKGRTPQQSRDSPIQQSSVVQEMRHSVHDHPIPVDQRPELSPPPTKRENAKSPSPDKEFMNHNQGQQQHHHQQPRATPYYNPYYSGATLPAYAPAVPPTMPQVYNMFSPPTAYPQPGLPNWSRTVNGNYRPAHPRTQHDMMRRDLPPNPSSPARESVDPPSDIEPPLPASPLGPPQPEYTPQMPAFDSYKTTMQRPEQGYWNNMSRPSIWQRVLRRPSQIGQEDNLGPDDSVTIRNWRKGVAPGGRAPTMLPKTPTVSPDRPNPGRSTMAPTAYLGQNGTYSGPGTTLYNARLGYSGSTGRRTRDSPSVWEKMISRHRTNQDTHQPSFKRKTGLTHSNPLAVPLNQSQRRYDRDIRRKEREERYNRRQKEKEERRKQRAARRDQRANLLSDPQHGLRREHFLRVDQRDKPLDVGGNQRAGRSGTLVGDWVGKFGMGRTREQCSNSDSQVRNYPQPKLWKHRLKLDKRTAQSRPPMQDQNPYSRPLPDPTQGLGPRRGENKTFKRSMRRIDRLGPTTNNLSQIRPPQE